MKKLLALLLAALMVFGMAACAKTAETPAADTPAGETTATADKPAEETTADETPAESDGDKIVIHYWAQWTENEAQAEVYKAAIARFEQAHPDCTVEVNWAGRDVREILRASIDSGNAIDIVDSGFDQIVNLLGEDYLMDLTSYMEGSDFEKAISAGMAAFAKSFASDGTSWYYIPSQPFVGTIYYNKAIFAEAGIDAMPTTWSEFMDVCQKIKDAGYDPITVDDAYYPCLYGTYLAMMKGPDWVTELLSDTTGANWSDPAVAQMADDFAAMRANGYFSDSCGSNVFPSAQNGEFAMGTAAMYYNGSWLPNEVHDITGDDFQWGAMFFPAPDNAEYPYTTYSTGCQFFGITKGCEHPEEALALLEQKPYDLLLLDVNMHGMDGFQVVQAIRRRGLRLPIIIVSGRKEDYDTLYGLDIGADDYVTKPFNPVTLGAKVKALIRRSRNHLPGVDSVIAAGPFQYNTSTLRFYKNGREILLSSKENAMMKLFIDNVNRIFSKDMLYDLIWGEAIIDENAIMVYVNRLRQKIEEDPSNPQYIQTVRGLGYRFVV